MVSSDEIAFEVSELESILVEGDYARHLDGGVIVGKDLVTLTNQPTLRVESALDAVKRIQAYLCSLAYVSCMDPQWCSLHQVRLAVEMIWTVPG